MQLRLPWDVEPRDARAVRVDGQDVPVQIVRHRRARRYVLRLADDGSLKLTVPRGASIAGGVRFAERQHDWIVRERGRQVHRNQPWGPGTSIWFRGEHVGLARTGDWIVLGADRVSRANGSGDWRPIVETHLRRRATDELPARCAELAAACDVRIARIAVRNQRSRWGACSARGCITLNWRLIQMPPTVSDYVIYHELMHVRHPNHSRRFWRAVESVCAWWRDGERWLRRHGREVL